MLRAFVRILKVPARKKISVQLRSQNIFFTIQNFEIFQKVLEHCAGCAGANEGPAYA
jgi:hypothetical protein